MKQLSEKIALEIIAYIRNNKLLPSTRLPGVRKLSEILKTSKNTVCDALEILSQEGMVETRAGSGSFVAKNSWFDTCSGTPNWIKFIDYNREKPFSTVMHKFRIEAKEQDIHMTSENLEPSFGFGEILCQALDDVKEDICSGKLFCNDPFGPMSLRKAVSGYLMEYKHIKATADNIIIAPEHRYALDYIIDALTENSKNSVVYAENACCSMLKATSLYLKGKITVEPLPSDRYGVRIDALKQIPGDDARKRNILLINPTRQYLHYKSMSNRRKHEVLDVCKKLKIPVIELDYFSDFTPNLKHLKAMDNNDSVIYLGALHSSVHAGIPTAWVVAPDYVIPKILDISISSSARQAHMLTYLIVEKMLTGGHYRKFLDIVGPKILERITLTNTLLDTYMQDIASWQRDPACGIFYLKFKNSISVKKIYEIRGNLSFLPGSFLEPGDDSNICFSPCSMTIDDLETALIRLSDIARRTEKLS